MLKTLEDIKERTLKTTSFPSSIAQCGLNKKTGLIDYNKGCGLFDGKDELLHSIMEMSRPHVPVEMAICSCASSREELARQRHQQRLADARLPHHTSVHRTFDNFKPMEGTETALKAALDFTQGIGSNILVLAGGVGCGKSHLLEAIGRELLNQGKTVRYRLVADYVDDLRQAESTNTKFDLMDRIYITNTMILDDLGVERVNEYALEEITKLIEHRLMESDRNCRLVIATNLNYQDMTRQFDQRIADRLWATSLDEVTTIPMTATSYRQPIG